MHRASSSFSFIGAEGRLEAKRCVDVTGQGVLPLMIQTARKHEQGSKQKTKTRPTSAAPVMSRPHISTSASHEDALAHPDDQASFAAVHATNIANTYTLLYLYADWQAR